MNKDFNLISVIRTLLKWKWSILGVTVLSGVVAVITTVFFMDDYYESSAVFYPTNQYITDRSSLFNSTGGEASMNYFGTKHDANRCLSIAESSRIIDFMVNWYKLAEHYDIDTTRKYWRFETKEEFLSNYTAIKTEKDAIQISILDKNPKLAADMVNMIVSKIDEANKEYVLKNKFKIKDLFKEKVAEKEAELQQLADSIAFLSKRYDITEKIIAEGVFDVKGKNKTAVETFRNLRSKQLAEIENLNEIRKLYDQNEIATRQNPASVYILEKAYPADRKAKPVRSLICLTTVLITFFLSLLAVLMIEQWQSIKLEIAREH